MVSEEPVTLPEKLINVPFNEAVFMVVVVAGLP